MPKLVGRGILFHDSAAPSCSAEKTPGVSNAYTDRPVGSVGFSVRHCNASEQQVGGHKTLRDFQYKNVLEVVIFIAQHDLIAPILL